MRLSITHGMTYIKIKLKKFKNENLKKRKG